jgi:hypothetical protein
LINKASFTTIIVSLRNPQIKQHEAKLHIGSFVQIKKFGMANKSEKSFDKGDMPIVLKV